MGIKLRILSSVEWDATDLGDLVYGAGRKPRTALQPRLLGPDLDQIICLKLERKIRKDHTVLFGNEMYAITAKLSHSIARKQADIRIYSNGQIKGFYGGQDLELRQERKKAWAKGEKPKFQADLTTRRRVLGTDLLLHTAS